MRAYAYTRETEERLDSYGMCRNCAFTDGWYVNGDGFVVCACDPELHQGYVNELGEVVDTR